MKIENCPRNCKSEEDLAISIHCADSLSMGRKPNWDESGDLPMHFIFCVSGESVEMLNSKEHILKCAMLI